MNNSKQKSQNISSWYYEIIDGMLEGAEFKTLVHITCDTEQTLTGLP